MSLKAWLNGIALALCAWAILAIFAGAAWVAFHQTPVIMEIPNAAANSQP